ncbi:MAG: septum formation initiator family protein [candidate division WOR-3 bacterium]
MKKAFLSIIKRWLIIIIFILLPLSYLSRKIFLLASAYHREKILKKNIIILEAENELLKRRIVDYKKGTLIETKARDDLGMIKKGEKIYIIKK